MVVTPFGLTAGRTPGTILPYIVNSAGLKEGAVVIFDSSAIKGAVKAPTASGNVGIAGVLVDVIESGGTTSGSTYNVQSTGIVPVLLGNGEAVTVGGKLQINDTDGSVKALGSTDSCDILGTTLQTLTAGSANDMIMVELRIQFTGDTVP